MRRCIIPNACADGCPVSCRDRCRWTPAISVGPMIMRQHKISRCQRVPSRFGRLPGRCVCVAFVLALLPLSSCERDSDNIANLKEKPASEVEAADRASTILREYSANILSREHWQVRISTASEIEHAANELKTSGVYTLAMHRPDRLALLLESGVLGFNVVADGERIQVWQQPSTGKWDLIAPIPRTANSLLDESLIGKVNGTLLDTIWLMKSLVDPDPKGHIDNTMSDIRYVGLDRVESEDLLRLKMTHREADLDVWFTSGELRLLRRVFVEFRGKPGDGRHTVELKYDDWDFQPVDDSIFAMPSPKKPGAEVAP